MIDGEGFLKKRGFKVLEKQKPASIITYIDGKSHLSSENADYIVEWQGKKFAVKEISEIGADPSEPSIRRRLIEFKSMFSKYQILFMNLTSEEIHEVHFEFKTPGMESFFTILVALIIIVMTAAAIILLTQLKMF